MGKNNNKRTYALLLLLGTIFFSIIVSGSLVDDINEEICDWDNINNGSVMGIIGINGSWYCGNLLNQNLINITVNNITNIMTNYSEYCGVLVDGDDTYVPYKGATGDVDLNGYKLYARELQANSTLFGSSRIDGKLELFGGASYIHTDSYMNTTAGLNSLGDIDVWGDLCFNGTECIADKIGYWEESEGSLSTVYDLFLTNSVGVNAPFVGWWNVTSKGAFCINSTNPQCIYNWQDLNQSGEADTVWELSSLGWLFNSSGLTINESKFNFSEWNEAYSWGNHADEGYLTEPENPFDQDLNSTSETVSFEHADVTDLNVGPKGASYALTVDGRGYTGAPMYIYSSDAGNTITTSGSSVINTGGSSNFRSGSSQTFQVKDTASEWSYVAFGTWDTSIYSASYPFRIYPFKNHTRFGQFYSIPLNTLVFNLTEVRHYNNVKIYDEHSLEVTGNLTVGGNIVVDGCIQYNCSGGGCITLGDCL